MSGNKSRDKGASGERELAKILRDRLGMEIKRNWQGQAAEGGHDINGVPFSLEVKRYKTATDSQKRKWWNQTIDQIKSADSPPPALAYRKDSQEWRFVLPLDLIVVDASPSDHYEWTAEIGLEPFVQLCKDMVSD